VKARAHAPAAMLLVGLCGPVVAGPSPAAPCAASTPALDRMEESTVVIDGTGSETAELRVKVADDSSELAAGFQNICAEAIGDTAVLFRFPAPTRTPFHMRNVRAPLDIAFIDAEGQVVDVRRMEPYVDSVVFIRYPTYRSARPFSSTLETAAGKMEALGIRVGSRLTVR